MATVPTLLSVQVDCVSDDVLRELIAHIKEWQEEDANQHTDLNHEKSLWTGRFYKGFLSGKPASWKFSVALRNMTSPATTVDRAVRVLNLKETRDLLARVKFFYQGTLSRTDTASLLPNGMLYRPEDGTTIQMTTDLMKVASDGTSAILIRTFHWVLYKVKDPAFMALDRSNEAERQAFWFAGLDRVTVVWILKYIRDGLDFEWLVEAADRHDSLRLVHAADAVFLYMIDAKPDDDMIFPVRNSGLASAAEYWRQGMQTFTGSEPYHVPLGDWPVRLDLQYRKKRVVTAGPSTIS